MLWKPKSPAIVHAPAEALDRYGNLRIGGGCPAPRRMMMAAAGAVDAAHASVADDWEPDGAIKDGYTLTPAGKFQPDGTDSGLRLVDGHKFAGDFEVTATFTTVGTEFGFGVYPVSEDATFNSTLSVGAITAMTSSWWWNGSLSQVRFDNGNVKALSFSNADTWYLRRVGSTLSIGKNDSEEHEWTQTSSVEVRLVIGCGSASTPVLNDLQWTGGG